MNKIYTQVPLEYIKGNNQLTTQQLVVLTVILLNRGFKDAIPFTINSVIDTLRIKKTSTTTIKNVIATMQELADNNIITYVSDTIMSQKIDIAKVNNNTLIYAVLINNIDLFTVLYDEDIYKVLNYTEKNKIDKYNLLGIYIYLMSCINRDESNDNYLICYPSYETIASDLNIISNTISNYIEALNTIEVIYSDYAGFKEVKKGLIKNSNMYYAHYSDKSIVDAKNKQITTTHGFIKQDIELKNKSNERRSLKMKINNLTNKTKLTKKQEEELKTLTKKYKELIEQKT